PVGVSVSDFPGLLVLPRQRLNHEKSFPNNVPPVEGAAPVHDGTENTGPQKIKNRKAKIMNLPNANELAATPGNFFVPVSRPINTLGNWVARRERMKRTSPFAARSISPTLARTVLRMPLCARNPR